MASKNYLIKTSNKQFVEHYKQYVKRFIQASSSSLQDEDGEEDGRIELMKMEDLGIRALFL